MTKKRESKSNYYLLAGIIIGCLAMGVYLFPSFIADRINNYTNLDVKVKGEVASADSNSWSEDWRISEWRTASLRLTRDGYIQYWDPDANGCGVSSLPSNRGWECKGNPPWNWGDSCGCHTIHPVDSRPVAIGPSEMKVRGEVNGKTFRETWTAGGWANSNYNNSPRKDYNIGGNSIIVLSVVFQNMPEGSGYLMDSTLHTHPLMPDKSRRIFYATGEYGYSSAVWEKKDDFRAVRAHVDSGRSMPTTWRVEGQFTGN